VVVGLARLLMPVPAEVRLPRTFLLDVHFQCNVVLVPLLDDDFYRRRHDITGVGVGRPLLRRGRGLRRRRGAGVHSHVGGRRRLPRVVALARDAASLRVQSSPGARATAGRRSQPLAKVAVRAKRAGFARVVVRRRPRQGSDEGWCRPSSRPSAEPACPSGAAKLSAALPGSSRGTCARSNGRACAADASAPLGQHQSAADATSCSVPGGSRHP
jgi:hypothetical protein